MMTKAEYKLKLCKNSPISPTRNLLKSLMPNLASKLRRKTSKVSTHRNFYFYLMLCAAVAISLLFLLRATVVRATTRPLEENRIQVTYPVSQWTSVAVTPPIAFTISVLPSLLDSLESALAKTISTSTSTVQSQLE